MIRWSSVFVGALILLVAMRVFQFGMWLLHWGAPELSDEFIARMVRPVFQALADEQLTPAEAIDLCNERIASERS